MIEKIDPELTLLKEKRLGITWPHLLAHQRKYSVFCEWFKITTVFIQIKEKRKAITNFLIQKIHKGMVKCNFTRV